MSGRGILDADMQTIGRWLAAGWQWWIEEIGGLVPPRWRHAGAGRLPMLLATVEGLVPVAGRRDDAVRAGTRVTIVVPRDRALVRQVDRPAMGRRDLDRMLALDGEVLLPMPQAAMVIAARRLGPTGEPGRMAIEVAGLPLATAASIAAAVRHAGVLPAGVILASASANQDAIDFTAAMRAAGLADPVRSAAAPAWAVVAFLVLLNVATAIWRDAAAVDRLDARVAGQAPAVAVARTIARRIAADRMLVARVVAARRRHAPLDDLGAVSRALPAGAWVQRYVWDGATVRLAGYKGGRTDVIGALRRGGRYVDVRSLAEEGQPDTPAGQPFELVAATVVR